MIFPEAGFASLEAPHRAPWDETRRKLSMEDQARCYEAIYKAFWGKPGLRGSTGGKLVPTVSEVPMTAPTRHGESRRWKSSAVGTQSRDRSPEETIHRPEYDTNDCNHS